MGHHALPNLSLQVTNACNLDCMHCDFQKHVRTHGRERPTHILPQFFAKIVEQYGDIRQDHPKSLSLAAGGEALVHPMFLELCACAEDNEIAFGFDTNATLLTPDTSKRLLSMPHFRRIVFSIDSLDPTTYATIRKGGNLEQVHENVLGFLRLAKAMGRSDVSTRVNMVLQEGNTLEQFDFMKFWAPKVNQVNVTLRRFGTRVPTLHWQPDQREPCRFLYNHMRVLTNGDVVVCCLDDAYSSVIGNIQVSQLADVWNGSAYKDLRARQEKGDFTTPEICKDCNCWAGFYPPRKYERIFPSIVCGERPMNLVAISVPLDSPEMVEYLSKHNSREY